VEAMVHGGRHRGRDRKSGQSGRVLVDPAAATGVDVVVVIGVVDVYLVRVDADDRT
jgi:hypothetical protein